VQIPEKMTKTSLILEDGTVYEGNCFGAENSVPGEVGKEQLD
jgi:carbamoylphosphate synthase small subunit